MPDLSSSSSLSSSDVTGNSSISRKSSSSSNSSASETISSSSKTSAFFCYDAFPLVLPASEHADVLLVSSSSSSYGEDRNDSGDDSACEFYVHAFVVAKQSEVLQSALSSPYAAKSSSSRMSSSSGSDVEQRALVHAYHVQYDAASVAALANRLYFGTLEQQSSKKKSDEAFFLTSICFFSPTSSS